MLRVRDIMTRDVAVVSPETTLRDAIEILAREQVSGAPVVSGRTIVGVLSNTDLLGFAATLRSAPTMHDETPADEDWKDREPELEIDGNDAPASAFFSEMWDDDVAGVSERMGSGESPEMNALEAHTVSEVMTQELWWLPSDADARAAADLMREHGIHRVLVVDDGALAGIVSALDIAKAVSDRRFTTRAYVFNHEHDFG